MKSYATEVSYQCAAVSKATKKRCERDATHFHAGKNYCSCHHALILKEKHHETTETLVGKS